MVIAEPPVLYSCVYSYAYHVPRYRDSTFFLLNSSRMKRHKAVLEYLGMYVYSCNSLVYAVDLVSDTVDLGIKKYDKLF